MQVCNPMLASFLMLAYLGSNAHWVACCSIALLSSRDHLLTVRLVKDINYAAMDQDAENNLQLQKATTHVPMHVTLISAFHAPNIVISFVTRVIRSLNTYFQRPDLVLTTKSIKLKSQTWSATDAANSFKHKLMVVITVVPKHVTSTSASGAQLARKVAR